MIGVEKQSGQIAFPIVLILAIIVGMFIISFYYVYSAVLAYSSGAVEEAFSYALLSTIGIGISLYVTRMIRKRAISQKPPPKIVTTIECKECSFKKLKLFEKGDHIFKSVGSCQKCNEPMLITAIYSEKTNKK